MLSCDLLDRNWLCVSVSRDAYSYLANFSVQVELESKSATNSVILGELLESF